MPRASFKRFARKVVNTVAEKKYFAPGANVDTSVDIAGYIFSMSEIAQGDTDITRDGDQIYLRSITYSVTAQNNISFQNQGYVRVIIFQWLEYDVTAPAVQDVLHNVVWDSMYSHDTRYSFRVLKDMRLKVTPPLINTVVGGVTTINSVGYSNKHGRITKFAQPRLQYISGGLNGVNKIFCLVIALEDEQVGVSVRWKLNFTDA